MSPSQSHASVRGTTPRSKAVPLIAILLTLLSSGALQGQCTDFSDPVRNGIGPHSIIGCLDCSSGAASLGFTANVFGNSYTTVFVNSHGHMTFDGAEPGNHSPMAMNTLSQPTVAPFLADMDLRPSGIVSYGTLTVDGRSAFGSTWFGGYFNQHDDKTNTFQVLLIDRADLGAGDFDIEFNYNTIAWETGDSDGGTSGFGGNSAAAGVSDGVGSQHFDFPGSLVPSSLPDSHPTTGLRNYGTGDLCGRHLLAMRQGVLGFGIVPGFSSTFSPSNIATNQTTRLVFTIDNLNDPYFPGSGVGNPIPVTALDFTDTLPTGLAIAANPAIANTCGGTLGAVAGQTDISLSGGVVPANGQCTVSLDVTANTPGSYVNTSSVLVTEFGDGDTSQATLSVINSADLSISHVAIPNPAVAGESLTYTAAVFNAGPSDAFDVLAQITLPVGVFFMSTSGCGEDPAGLPLCSLGTIPTSTSKQFTFEVDVDSATVAALDSQLDVSSTTHDGLTDNNTHSLATTVDVAFDLTLTKSDLQDPAVAGEMLDYLISIHNAGPSDAVGVEVTDLLNLELQFLVTSGCTEDPDGLPTCTLGDIPSGTTRQFAVATRVDASASGSVSNTARVSQPLGLDVTGSATTPINQEADLRVSLSGDSTLDAGQTLAYTLMVENLGPSDVASASIVDIFPSDLSGVSWTCTAVDGSCTAGAGTLSENVSLDVGGTLTYEITGTVDADTPAGILTNTATVSSSVTDPDSANNSAAFNTDIQLAADLGVAIVGPTMALAGEVVSFDLAADNAGLSQALGSRVVQTTANLENVTWTCLASGGSCPASGVGLVDAFVDLDPSGVATFTIQGQIQGDFNGSFPYSATIAPALGVDDDTSSNDASSGSITVSRQADLTLQKSGSGVVNAGEAVSYSIQISNGGPSNLSSATVTDNFPPEILNATWSCTASAGSTCAASGSGDINDTSVSLLANGLLTYSIIGDTATDTAAGMVTNQATIAPEFGSDVSDSHAVSIETFALVDLDLSGPSAATAGQSIGYTILVTNDGPSSLTSGTLSAVTPAALVNLSWTCSPSAGSCSGGTGTLSDSVDLAPGGSLTYSLTADIDPAASGSVDFLVDLINPGGFDVNASLGTSLSRSADLMVSMSGDTVAEAGTGIGYDVVVQNNGLSSVSDVRLQDTFPSELSGVTWACSPSPGSCPSAAGAGNLDETFALAAGDQVTFVVTGTVASGATATSLNNTATVSSTVEDLLPGNNSASFGTTLSRRAEIQVDATGSSTALAGDTANYTVTISNAGPSSLDDLRLLSTVSAQISDLSWTCLPSVGNCAVSGQGSLDENVILPVGGLLTYSFTASVAADATGDALFSVSAILPAGVSDDVPADNSSTVMTTVDQEADLSLTKSGDVNAVAGQSLNYTVTVSNGGPSEADATVDDTFPSGLSNIQWTCTSQQATCSPSGSGSLTEDVQIEPGGAVTFAISADIASDALGSLINDADVTSAVDDPLDTNDSDSHETTLDRRADVRISKTGPGSVGAGGALTYTLTVTNDGPSDADGLTVSDAFSSALSNIDWTCTRGGSPCGNGSGNIAHDLDLALDEQAVIQVTADVSSSFTGLLSNTASVAVPGGITDPTPGNNSDSHDTVVNRQADLSIAKTGDASVIAGETLAYTLIVTNHGPSEVSDATVNDLFHSALSQVSWTCTAVDGTCQNASGSGSINARIDLQVDGTATFDITARVASDHSTGLSNTASVSPPSGTDDPATSNNSSTHPTSVERQADLAVALTGPTTAAAGGVVQYTLEVQNHGPSDVEARVQDDFPALLTNVQWTCVATDGSCPAAGVGDIDHSVELESGGSLSFTINATLGATASGSFSQTANAAPDDGATDPNAANDAASFDTDVERQADLAVTQSGSATSTAGGTVDYLITAINNGPSDVVGATVSDSFPSELSAVQWTCVATLGACPASGNGDLNTPIDLEAGGRAVFTVSGQVSASATGSFDNLASIAVPLDVDELNGGNNSANHVTQLTGQADLALNLSGDATGTPGQMVQYTLRLDNFGPSNVVGATLSTVFAADLGSVTWTCTAFGGSCPGTGSGDIATTVDVDAAGHLEFAINALIDGSATGSLLSTAGVTSPTNSDDPVSGNDTSSHSTSLAATADLNLTVTESADPATAGAELTYTLQVTNGGPSSAADTELTLQLDADTQWQNADIGCQEVSPGVGRCQLGDLALGASLSRSITVRLDTAADGPLLATAGAQSLADDPTPNGQQVSTDVDYRADLSLTKSDGQGTAVPGESLTYVVTARNSGPSDVVGATVQDLFPAELLNPSWSCSPSPGAVCSLNGSGNLQDTVNLPAGGVLTYTVQTTLSPSANGSVSNTASIAEPAGVSDDIPGNNSATDLNTLGSEADVHISLSNGQSSTVPGNQVIYSVGVGNRGPSEVQAAVRDSLPGSLSMLNWTCSASGGSTCGGSGTGSLSDDPALRVGGMVTYTVTATVDPQATGILSYSVSVTPPVGVDDHAPGDNSASDNDLLAPQADLAVALSDGVSNVRPGDSLIYTLSVSNLGPSDALGARVRDTLPSMLSAVTWSCTTTAGATCGGSASGGSGVGNLDDLVDLAAGSSIVYSIQATLDSGFSGHFTNSASVTAPSSTPDPNSGNNSASDQNSADPESQLRLTLDDGASTAVPGSNIVYAVEVHNDGPSAVSGAQIQNALPVQLQNCAWTCTPGSGASCALGQQVGSLQDSVNLGAGTSLNYSLACDIASNATGTLINSASIAAPAGTSDPNLLDNVAQDLTALGPQTNLAISKTDGLTEATPGGALTYTLTVVNEGPSDAPGVLVTDTFPAQLACVWTCVSAGGATCTPGQVAGDLIDTFDMPAGSTAIYSADCDIAPDASGTLSNVATLTPPGTVSDTNPNDNSASDLDTVLVPRFDLSLGKTDGRSTAQPGDLITYTLTVDHTGLSDAIGATVSDVLPSALNDATWTCNASPGSLCSASGTGDVADTVTLRSGGQLTYSVQGTVASDAQGTLLNQASISTPSGAVDSNPSNNADSDSTAIEVALDLAIAHQASPAVAVPGQGLAYTVTVNNLGPSDAVGARILAGLPTSLLNPTWTCTASPGSSCAAAGSGTIDETATVLVGGSLSYSLLGSVDAAATGVLPFTAQVSPAVGLLDSDLSNNVASLEVPLAPTADLAIVFANLDATAVPGLDLSYDLVIENLGSSDAFGVVVQHLADDALACTWTCLATGGATCAAGPVADDIDLSVDLPASSRLTFSLHCDIDAAATGNLDHGANVTPPAGWLDPSLSNNTAQQSTVLAPQADLVVSKSDGRTQVQAGTSTTYTIEVSNPSGPSAASQVHVRDTFPTSLDCTWTCSGIGGGICTPGQVAGDIDDDVDLPVGARVVYTAPCQIDADAQGELINSATATPPAGLSDPNGSNNSSLDSSTIEAVVDLAIDLDDGVQQATPGDSLTYTLLVDNVGSGDAMGATVQDSFPDALTCTWSCVASGGGVCTAGQVVGDLDDTVDLPSGAQLVYSAVCSIDADATGVLANTATVIPPSGIDDAQPSNNSASDLNTQLVPRADLAISKSDGVISGLPGGTVTYIVSASNLSGPSDAVDASVVDHPPSDLSCTWSCASSGGATCTAVPPPGDLDDTVQLPVGSLVTYSGQCVIAETASGALVNTATVEAAQGSLDPDLDNNSATDDDTVLLPTVDLSITVDADTESPVAGGQLTYQIVASNPVDLLVLVETSRGLGVFSLDIEGGTETLRFLGQPDDAEFQQLVFSETTQHPLDGSRVFLDPNGIAGRRLLLQPTADGEDLQASNSVVFDLGAAGTVPMTDDEFSELQTIRGLAFVPPAAVVGARVRDNFPAPTSCVWTCVGSGGGQCSAGPVSGNIDDSVDLPAGAEVSYSAVCTLPSNAVGDLLNTASVEPPPGVTERQPSDNSATVGGTIVQQADLLLSKSDGVTSAHPGGSVIYTLVASNLVGPSDVADAQVVDFFAAELACLWTCEASGGATCTPGQVAGDIQDSVDLPVGGIATYSAVCNIDPAANGQLSNTATLLPPIGVLELNPSDNSAADLDTVLVPRADLAITVDDGLTQAIPGESSTYTLTVHNAGPSDVATAQVSDTFPSGLDCLWSCTASAGGSCTPGQVAGNIDDTVSLAVGAQLTYQAVCDIDPGLTGSLDNLALISLPAPGIDPDPSNNQARDDDTLLRPTADLSLSKTNGVDVVHPGGSVTYDLLLSNPLGPSHLAGSIVDSLASTLSGCSWTCTTTGGATCGSTLPVGDLLDDFYLPVAATATYRGTCDIAVQAEGLLANTASLMLAEGVDDPDLNNNSASDVDEVTPLVDLTLSVDDGEAEAAAGDTLLYTVAVANLGPSQVAGATVQVDVPASLSCSWTCQPNPDTECLPGPDGDDLQGTASLAPSSTVTFEGSCGIDPAATGTLTAVGNVLPAAGDQEVDLGNNSDIDHTTLRSEADLSISKDDGQVSAMPGESVIYAIQVSNAGPSSAAQIQVEDLFPAELSCTWTCAPGPGATPSSGCDSAVQSGDLIDEVDLEPGANLLYSANCTIDPAANGSLLNTATVGDAGGIDPHLDNNSAVDIDELGNEADLAVVMIDSPDPVASGNLLLYRATVTNLGPLSDSGVTATWSLPPAVNFVTTFLGEPGQLFSDGFESGNTDAWGSNSESSVIPEGELCDVEGSSLSCQLGNLAAGQTVDLVVVVEVVATTGSTLVATVSVSGQGSDPDSGNNSASAITTVGDEGANSQHVSDVPGTSRIALSEVPGTSTVALSEVPGISESEVPGTSRTTSSGRQPTAGTPR